MFKDRKDAVWVILSGCRHEGYLVQAVKVKASEAEGSWNNLKGLSSNSDLRIELWVDGKLCDEINYRNYGASR